MRRVMTILVLSAVGVVGTAASAWAGTGIPDPTQMLSKLSFG